VPNIPGDKRRELTWAERIQRIFGIDVTVCEHCGGVMKKISVIHNPAELRKIIEHIRRTESQRPPARGPPEAESH
jgi:hypothetical protein